MKTPARAVLQQARAVPEEPCLFFQEERRGVLDWAWWSWRQLARQVVTGMEALVCAGAEPLETVVFPYRPLPEYLAFDLAVQAVGALAVPVWVPEFRLPEEELDAWRSRQMRIVEQVPPAPEVPSWARSRGEDPDWPEVVDGGVRLDGEQLDAVELLRRVEALEARLPVVPVHRFLPAHRDVVVCCRSLTEAGERLVLSWALSRGAAVALDASPDAWLDVIGWVRPTLLHGSADALVEAGRELAREHRRWWRRLLRMDSTSKRLAPPLDRLRAIVVTGDERLPVPLPDEAHPEALPDEESAAWESFGIRVV